MSLLPTGVRRRLQNRVLAAPGGLARGPGWDGPAQPGDSRPDSPAAAPGPGDQERLLDGFHRLYYDAGEAGGTWKDTSFLGVTTWKSPLDLWVYQELVWELRPGLIVETGTAHGGSALYLASLCETVGGGEVVSVDIGEWPDRPAHPRLTYVVASSTDPRVVAELAERAAGAGVVLVVLDSDHSRDHVLAELRAYAPLVTPGSYLVVEDTNINGHPVYEAFGPGPMEAVHDFLKERDDFEVDRTREKFLFSFNPGGWLRKVG
jgi:cephalosporin hydroxylase